jgi:hypothetical protein
MPQRIKSGSVDSRRACSRSRSSARAPADVGPFAGVHGSRRRRRRLRRRTCCGPRSRAGLRVLIAGPGRGGESVERPDVSAYLYQWP